MIPSILLALVSCGNAGELSIWDHMGEGIVSSITPSNIDVSGVTQGDNSINSSLKVDTIENATNIDLNNVDKVSIDGVKYQYNVLKIEKAGSCALSGTLNDAVEVKGVDGSDAYNLLTFTVIAVSGSVSW